MKRAFIESAVLAALVVCASACERNAQSHERSADTAGHDAGTASSSPIEGMKGHDASALSAPIAGMPDASHGAAPVAPLQITGGVGGSGGSGGLTGSGPGGSGGSFGTGGTITGGTGGSGGGMTGGAAGGY